MSENHLHAGRAVERGEGAAAPRAAPHALQLIHLPVNLPLPPQPPLLPLLPLRPHHSRHPVHIRWDLRRRGKSARERGGAGRERREAGRSPLLQQRSAIEGQHVPCPRCRRTNTGACACPAVGRQESLSVIWVCGMRQPSCHAHTTEEDTLGGHAVSPDCVPLGGTGCRRHPDEQTAAAVEGGAGLVVAEGDVAAAAAGLIPAPRPCW